MLQCGYEELKKIHTYGTNFGFRSGGILRSNNDDVIYGIHRTFTEIVLHFNTNN